MARNYITEIEARLRALEALIQSLPSIVTPEIFALAREDIEGRRYRHPDSAGLVTADEQRKLEVGALDEIERQMRENPAG